MSWLPLVVGCANESETAAPASRPADAPAPADRESPPPTKAEPAPEPAPTTAVRPGTAEAEADSEWGQQSMPPDLGARIEPPVVPETKEDRPMATKYGLPPRPARKYGAPPRPGGGPL